MNPYTIREAPDATVVQFDEVKSGWQQWFLLSSDRHWDSKYSDRAMQKRHLDQALERNALIIDLGDVLDLMQGRNDRRGSKSSIRPEHNVDDYYSAVIQDAIDWFEPYAKNWLLLAEGNHETSVKRHAEIDPTRLLVAGLNDRAGANIIRGSYNGWVKLQFRASGRKSFPAVNIYYSHGSGGSSPVTRGVISTNRRAVYLPDANVVLSGHIHSGWQVPIPRERLTDQGSVYVDEQMHISVPTYKRGARRSGWEAEKGFAPTPIGAVWMRLYYHDERVRTEFTFAQ